MPKIDLSPYNVPPECDRTDQDREDIQISWDIVENYGKDHLLNSTEGSLAILRALRLGRSQRDK